MKISVITLFPDMIKGFVQESIIKRSMERGIVDIDLVNLRDFAVDSYGTVDEKPYGGGVGMLLRVDVLHKALKHVQKDAIDDNGKKAHIILTSAKGKRYDQKKARELSKKEHIVILCGHYEGVDERILDYVDEEVSIGDFVLTGGEIVAAALIDSTVRLLPGSLKHTSATENESFFTLPIEDVMKIIGENNALSKLMKKGVKYIQLIEYPHYTRPESYDGKKVPDVLISGHHKMIDQWRIKEAFYQTVNKRPDLLGIEPA